ncbi:MAG: hypothetical protein ABI743_03110 [bacterium]
MEPSLTGIGTLVQIILILLSLCAALSMIFGLRTISTALALLALSFVGMAMRGEPAALVAVAMGVLMELRLAPRGRHRGLLEWLLVALGLCQVALILVLPMNFTFWLAQAMGVMVLGFAVVATFAPHWYRTPLVPSSPGFLGPNQGV